MPRGRELLAIAVCVLVVGACSAGSGSTPGTRSPGPAVAPTQAMSSSGPPSGPGGTSSPTPVAVSGQPGTMLFEEAWATATLTDVATGKQFRITDLAAQGKVIFVETMATWCPNCLSQQRDLATAFAQGLDATRVELVELDVDPSESATELANYRAQNGFDFRYAVAGSDVSRALADEFGDVVLNPSSVNLIILGTDGTVTHTTGHHGPADVIMLASQHGA